MRAECREGEQHSKLGKHRVRTFFLMFIFERERELVRVGEGQREGDRI